MLSGFRNFIARGNVIDLAVAVVIGAAFGAVVTSLVTNIITPIIGIVLGDGAFEDLIFKINGSEFGYGAFINALISFIAIAAVIYFLVVAPLEALEKRRKGPEGAKTRPCPECLSDVPVAAKRCAFCTSELPAAPAT